MKKKIYSLLALFAIAFVACGSDSPETPSTNPDPTTSPNAPTETTFVRGADISWYTEMAADGKHFYNVAGEERTCPVLM